MINNFDTWLNESHQLLSKEDIEKWLDQLEIKNYTINDDLTVDVKGYVILDKQTFEQFPVKFNKVGGNFSCRDCINLTSLEGAPLKVRGSFSCRGCINLTSLKSSPQEVGGHFFCSNCNNLTTLEGATQEVGRDFYCSGCTALVSLEGSPRKVSGNFSCNECANLTSLKGAPLEVSGHFFCGDTIFDTLFDQIKYQDFIKLSKPEQDKLYIKWIDNKQLSRVLTPDELQKYRGSIHGSKFGI